jgi:hypothetical protein
MLLKQLDVNIKIGSQWALWEQWAAILFTQLKI